MKCCEEVKRIKNAVKRRFIDVRTKEINREENSVDMSDKGLKYSENDKVFKNKILVLFDKIVEEIYDGKEEEINRDVYVKTTKGMIPKSIAEKLVSLKNMGKTIPKNLVTFVTFETGIKYDLFVKGKKHGNPKKLQNIKEIFEKVIGGTLHIIPIDPRVKKTEEEKKDDNLDSRPSSFREEYGNQTHIGQNEAGIQKGIQV